MVTPATETDVASVALWQNAQLKFDYSVLEESVREVARQATFHIRVRLEAVQRNIVEVGEYLINVKTAVGHGHFGRWLAAEFGMSDDTAERFMNVARRLPELPHGAEFAPSVLYALVAPSTPDSVIRVALNRAQAGETITREDVRVLKEIAADPLGRRALKQVAKEVRAEDLKSGHVERQIKIEQIAARNPALPCGRTFAFVYLDLPRKPNVYSDDTGSEKSPAKHFPVMDFHESLDFAIDRFAAKDAIVSFWSTAASLIDDIEILADWGFVSLRPRDANGKIIRDATGAPLPPVGGGRYGSMQVWRKVRTGAQTGTGRWFLDQHEFMIFARRGDAPAPLPGTQDESVFEWPIGAHSEKPNVRVREMIDRVWPHLTKIEVFARGTAPPGWVFWGNQAQ